ncbi:hypothetical protein [Selenomonas ruminantium]|uniref:SGNH/GDSL hydrolase family protein n=1 Tax=Selenomonas ruminantium TaxID=971 RepID=A0A1I0XVN8_SELRU|nr:hypothetical protein [Selenomonas ruminantium]SFB04238.1 hypothetical protein SAMN05216587_107111 [Selenomonas ruminantium]
MNFYRKYLVIFSLPILAVICLHLLLFYINLGVPNNVTHGYNDIFQVKDNYAHSINKPKIVFASGSNTRFGVDTTRIEHTLKIPVVNYGISANLKYYILQRVKLHLHNGDIIILPLEYSFYDYQHIPVDANYAHYIIGSNISNFKALPSSVKLSIISQITTGELLKATYRHIKPSPYVKSKYCLNINGDVTNNFVSKKTPANVLFSKLNDSVFKNAPVTADAQEELTSFIDYCHANNITIYAAWPNYLWKEKEFKGKDLDGIHAIEKFYHDHNVEILGNYTDCLYDAELFYDSEYHLNEEGKRIHTDYLINLLKDKLPQR